MTTVPDAAATPAAAPDAGDPGALLFKMFLIASGQVCDAMEKSLKKGQEFQKCLCENFMRSLAWSWFERAFGPSRTADIEKSGFTFKTCVRWQHSDATDHCATSESGPRVSHGGRLVLPTAVIVIRDDGNQRELELIYQAGSNDWCLIAPRATLIDGQWCNHTEFCDHRDLPRRFAECIHRLRAAAIAQDAEATAKRLDEETLHRTNAQNAARAAIRQRSHAVERDRAKDLASALRDYYRASAWQWPCEFVFTWYVIQCGTACYITLSPNPGSDGQWRTLDQGAIVPVRLYGSYSIEARTADSVDALPYGLRQHHYADLPGFATDGHPTEDQPAEDQPADFLRKAGTVLKVRLPDLPRLIVRQFINGDARPAGVKPPCQEMTDATAAAILARLFDGQSPGDLAKRLLDTAPDRQDQIALVDRIHRTLLDAGIEHQELLADIETAWSLLRQRYDSVPTPQAPTDPAPASPDSAGPSLPQPGAPYPDAIHETAPDPD